MSMSAPAKLAMLSEIIGELEPLTSIQMLRTFIAISTLSEDSRGVMMKDIEKHLGMHSSTMSRNQQALGTRHANGKGMGLIESISDPGDTRAKLVFLTPRGRRMWERMKQVIQ
jgi:DNA-binding MarR family transcriptional regulator